MVKHYITALTEIAVKTQMTLSNSINSYQEEALKSYSAVIELLLKAGITHGNTAKLCTEEHNSRHGSLTVRKYTQGL